VTAKDHGSIVFLRWIKLESEFSAGTALRCLLDPGERARAGRFKFAADRDSYVAAHALLRVMLSEQAEIAPEDWRFVVAKQGKPEIDPSFGRPDLRFSLSHTRGMVACAVGLGHDLGVDVEAERQTLPVLEMAHRHFSPAEAKLVASAPPAERNHVFYRLWTLKEAYVKATGEGIAAALDSFSFSLSPLSISFEQGKRDRPDAWQFAEIEPGPRQYLALAVRRPGADPIRLDHAAVSPSYGMERARRPN
jgi:4'-phosphopantetheinyl transferase